MVDGTPELAHRVSWRLAYGEIPAGLVLCHKCDNPSCVNPAHLFAGTQRDNINDMLAKRRSSKGKSFEKRRGENHGMAKLTRAQVDEIRALYAAGGVLHRELAVRFGVDRSTIGLITRGEHWTAGLTAPTKVP